MTSMLAITVLMFSCANDKTFEGTWYRAESMDMGGATDVFVTFKSNKKVDSKLILISSGVTQEREDVANWSAKYAKKKLTIEDDDGKTECKFKFAKNFKEVTLSSCDGDYKEMLENTWQKQ